VATQARGRWQWRRGGVGAGMVGGGIGALAMKLDLIGKCLVCQQVRRGETAVNRLNIISFTRPLDGRRRRLWPHCIQINSPLFLLAAVASLRVFKMPHRLCFPPPRLPPPPRGGDGGSGGQRRRPPTRRLAARHGALRRARCGRRAVTRDGVLDSP